MNKRHLELIFAENADPGDLQILAEAQYDEPGRVKLLAARITERGRVHSTNGGALIGVIGHGEPLPPFNFSYWIEEGTSQL
jgi:hypothetical protein